MRYDVICAGMALVDSIIRGFDPEPVSASGYRAESGSLNVGGEAVNAAIAAAKLGMKTGIFCALGADPAGEMVRNELRNNGVDTGPVMTGPGTPVTTMFVRADGTRRSVTNLAHRYNFHPERDPALFTDARALILGSLFRAPFDDPAVIHAVLSSAKAAGQLIIADTKLPNFRFLTLGDIGDSLPMIDTITPNEDEARYFTGKEEPEDMADVFLAYGVRNVIIKLGGNGCLMKNRDTVLRLPAIPIDPVDATGAGDNFVAGYAAEILRGASEKEALRFANACGAICTTAVGAGTALTGRDQVLRMLGNAPAEESGGQRQKNRSLALKKAEEDDQRIGDFIHEEFTRYGERNDVALNYDGFCFTAEDSDGKIAGVITGRAYYNEVHIGDLIVGEAHRGSGLGSRLVRAVEDAYRGKGYDIITLTTFGFQAPEFYKKLGYRTEFIRENRDPKLSKYFLSKKL